MCLLHACNTGWEMVPTHSLHSNKIIHSANGVLGEERTQHNVMRSAIRIPLNRVCVYIAIPACAHTNIRYTRTISGNTCGRVCYTNVTPRSTGMMMMVQENFARSLRRSSSGCMVILYMDS